MKSRNQKEHWSRGAQRKAGRFQFRAGLSLGLVTVFLLAFAWPSEAGLKVYYIRHGQGGHNVVKEYENVPREQRPAYVGNPNVFTPKGEAQVAGATKKLQQYKFDFIGVSSMWRTRNTVLPYLKAVGAKGEIWPALHEFSGGSEILATNLPKASGQIVNAGPRVELPASEAPYFTFREDARNDFKLPHGKGQKREAALQVVVQHNVDLIRKRFGGTDKTILLVGHGNSGKALLRRLTGNKLADLPSMENTGIWMAEEQSNGKFELKMYNDTPCDPNGKAVPAE